MYHFFTKRKLRNNLRTMQEAIYNQDQKQYDKIIKRSVPLYSEFMRNGGEWNII